MTWSSVRVVSHATAVITSNYEVRALNSRDKLSLDMVTICVAYLSYTLYMVSSNVGHFNWPLAELCTACMGMWCDHLRWGVWYLYSALTTHLRCENSPSSITINGGNWLHNSCRRQASAWFDVYLRYVGVVRHQFCFHLRHDLALCTQLQAWGWGGQGP